MDFEQEIEKIKNVKTAILSTNNGSTIEPLDSTATASSTTASSDNSLYMSASSLCSCVSSSCFCLIMLMIFAYMFSSVLN